MRESIPVSQRSVSAVPSGTWGDIGKWTQRFQGMLPKSENRMRAMVSGGTAWVISSNMGFSTCCEPGTSRGPGIWATRPKSLGYCRLPRRGILMENRRFENFLKFGLRWREECSIYSAVMPAMAVHRFPVARVVEVAVLKGGKKPRSYRGRRSLSNTVPD